MLFLCAVTLCTCERKPPKYVAETAIAFDVTGDLFVRWERRNKESEDHASFGALPEQAVPTIVVDMSTSTDQQIVIDQVANILRTRHVTSEVAVLFVRDKVLARTVRVNQQGASEQDKDH